MTADDTDSANLFPTLHDETVWRSIVSDSSMLGRLSQWLKSRRWFSGKARRIEDVSIQDDLPLGGGEGAGRFRLLLIQVRHAGQSPETFLLPIGFARDANEVQALAASGAAAIMELEVVSNGVAISGVLYDALGDSRCGQLLLDVIATGGVVTGRRGQLRGSPLASYARLRGDARHDLPARLLAAEQSNSALVFGDRFLLKFFRRLEPGLNPDLELGRFLTEAARFPHSPQAAGSLEYTDEQGPSSTVGILQEFVPNLGNAWELTLNHVRSFFERLMSTGQSDRQFPAGGLVRASQAPLPDSARDLCGEYAAWANLLGERTADMHRALASAIDRPDFAPEPFSPSELEAMRREFLTLLHSTFDVLQAKHNDWPDDLRRDAERALAHRQIVTDRFSRLQNVSLNSARIRCHGDYHLGQVLWTGADFVIIDFEGEPARPLDERRRKRTPLRDVAGMIRSFDYASLHIVCNDLAPKAEPKRLAGLQQGAQFWSSWTSVQFLAGYVRGVKDCDFANWELAEIETLLDVLLLEKVVYEIAYELNNRPENVRIPLTGLLRLVESSQQRLCPNSFPN